TVARLDDAPPHIGRPIGNVRAYILDSRYEPVPVGVAGELYLGGDGVGRGYLGRPDLTAERFVPDPFAPQPGARMYRTGDLARFQPDGRIDFLGRLDHQVKLRGFRIELGEIEAALGAHPAVRGAAVSLRDEQPDRQALVAYVLLHDDQRDVAELRAYLERTLPAHFVPSVFVRLDAFPVTASGKIDRQRLPAPDLDRTPDPDAFAPALDPAAEIVALVWADLLGLAAVGLDDDFFALGGHSLLAARAASRLGPLLGVEIDVGSIFLHRTPRQ